MDHHRLKKYRGPETWARVKAAYVAGESAASVALRFDVSVANLRKKASREGWTRRVVAVHLDEALPRSAPDTQPGVDPPRPPRPESASSDNAASRMPLGALTPRDQMIEGLKLAALRLAEGRPQEGEALTRAARALADLTGTPPPTMDELAQCPIEGLEALLRAVEYRAWRLAMSLHEVEPNPPAGSEAFYFHLRDRYGLRPEEDAGRDRRWVAAHRPELEALWDGDGRVPAPPEPTDEEVRRISALLGAGLRLGEDGNLKTWAAEAARSDEAR
jgi:hypothetical protein